MRTPILLAGALAWCAGNMAFAADMDPSNHDNVSVTDVHKAESAKDDQTFITTAIDGGMLEVQASRLALRQANLPENVKDAAQAMIDDHTHLNETLSRIASDKNYDIPTTLDTRGARKLEKLQQEDGKGLDFLRAYDTFLVKSHKDAIALFEDTAKNTKDPDVRSFAVDALPTLQKHADMVGELPYAKEANEWWKFW